VRYTDSAGNPQYWDPNNGGWNAGSSNSRLNYATATDYNTIYWSNATHIGLILNNATNDTILEPTPVLWSNIYDLYGKPLWFYFGDDNLVYSYGSATSTGFNFTAVSTTLVSVRNERNITQSLFFDVTAMNTTCSYSNSSVSSVTYIYPDSCIGDVRISVVNNSHNVSNVIYAYPNRNYFMNMSNLTYTNLIGFLLREDQGIWYAVIVLDLNSNPIENATVSFSRYFSTAYTTVAQERTDTTGTANLFVDYQTTYQVRVEADGYVSSLFNLQPSTINRVTYVRLVSTGEAGAEIINITTPIDNVSLAIFPTETTSNTTIDLSYFISDSTSNLQAYGWDIYYQNVTDSILVNSENGTNPAGSTLFYTTGNESGLYIVDYWFIKSGFDQWNGTTTYSINYKGFGSFTTSDWGFGETTLALVAIFCTLLVMAFFARWNMAGAVFLGILVLGIFTFALGFISWYIFAVTLIVVLGLMFMRSGM
jgi:hypothetical protein